MYEGDLLLTDEYQLKRVKEVRQFDIKESFPVSGFSWIGSLVSRVVASPCSSFFQFFSKGDVNFTLYHVYL